MLLRHILRLQVASAHATGAGKAAFSSEALPEGLAGMLAGLTAGKSNSARTSAAAHLHSCNAAVPQRSEQPRPPLVQEVNPSVADVEGAPASSSGATEVSAALPSACCADNRLQSYPQGVSAQGAHWTVARDGDACQLTVRVHLPADTSSSDICVQAEPGPMLRVQVPGCSDIVVKERGVDFGSARAKRVRGTSDLLITCPMTGFS
jgi:hypothetical protein